jgi:hypothetical protein
MWNLTQAGYEQGSSPSNTLRPRTSLYFFKEWSRKVELFHPYQLQVQFYSSISEMHCDIHDIQPKNIMYPNYSKYC